MSAPRRGSSLEVVDGSLGASCPNCGAAVAADQHYCLSCGRPCAPLRLPFLEVLQSSGQQGSPAVSGAAANGYLPPLPPSEPAGPLQRYTGLFALVGVLLLTAVVGLLIGHWANGSGASPGSNAPQVIKLEGSGLGTVAAPSGSTTPAATTGGSTESSSGAGESKGSEHVSKQEEKEAAAPPKLAKAKKLSSSSAQKLSKLSGKKYEQEINKLANGTAPIETGG